MQVNKDKTMVATRGGARYEFHTSRWVSLVTTEMELRLNVGVRATEQLRLVTTPVEFIRRWCRGAQLHRQEGKSASLFAVVIWTESEMETMQLQVWSSGGCEQFWRLFSCKVPSSHHSTVWASAALATAFISLLRQYQHRLRAVWWLSLDQSFSPAGEPNRSPESQITDQSGDWSHVPTSNRTADVVEIQGRF